LEARDAEVIEVEGVIDVCKVLGLHGLLIVRSVRFKDSLGRLANAFGEFGVLNKLLEVGN